MKLAEFIEMYPEFKPYVEFLREFLEKPPEEIEVRGFGELGGDAPGERVLGFALKPDKLFFRDMPPSITTFVHELIHLCKKPEESPEEVYAYNLVNLIMFCAERGVKCDPFKMFALRIEDVERVLRKYGVSSIEEYYALRGIIPLGYEIGAESELAPSAELLGRPDYEEVAVKTFITELASSIPFHPEGSLEVKVLLDLCRLTRSADL
ncbi:MAG: hypothetical protein QW794_01885 [Thermosphaera sp.]